MADVQPEELNLVPQQTSEDSGDQSEGEDDEDTSSSSSDDEDIDVDPKLMTQLMALEADIDSNPNLYDKHIEYLELLRGTPLRARLRAAHERMASLFPLSETLWTEWVNDELAQVKGPEDIEFILSLFQRATKDYLSVNTWASYLEFLTDFDAEVQAKSAAGLDKMRQAAEASLNLAGLHPSEGHRLWATYRKYELELLDSLPAGKPKQQQEERVRSLFQRQLSVPLQGAETVLAEYTQWEQQLGKEVPPHVAKAHAKAVEQHDLRQPYEEAIAPGKPADAALLAAHMSYIKLEQAQGDASRVCLAYERAVAMFPVTHELWAQYCRYVDSNVKVPGAGSETYARAVRNCYWVGSLWAAALRCGSRTGLGAEEMESLLRRALAAGMQGVEDYMEVLLAHIDGLRCAAAAAPPELQAEAGQKLRAAFAEASQLIASYFPDYVDRSLRLPAYWAHCEAHVLRDQAAARKVWEDALKTPLGRYYEAWSAYVALERSLRNIKEARAIYRKAYGRKLEEGGQVVLCTDWLRFEREEGSADDFRQAQLKVEPILEEAAAAAAAAADAQAAAAAKAAAKQAPKLSKEEMAKLRQANDPNFAKSKAVKGKDKAATPTDARAKRGRSEEPGATDSMQEDEGPDALKRSRLDGPEPTTVGIVDHPMDEDVPATTAAVPVQQQQEQHADTDMDGASAPSTSKPAGMWYSDENTVFVRGLPAHAKEEDLRQLFQSCGNLQGVRITRDAEGKCKGFAYVEFSSEQGLQAAVALNGTQMAGRSLFIAKSAPPGHAGGRGGRGPRGGHRGGGRGGHGRGEAGHEQQHQYQQHGGRGGGGRGRHGLGFSGGRGAPSHHMKQHLQVDAAPSGKPPAQFMPRSVAAKSQQQQAGAGDVQPRSNDDFRKMLLGGRSA